MYRAALYSGCAGEDVPGGFVLTLAGECPLCGAERLEDGAPAPHEHLRRGGLATRPRRDWKGLRQRRLCTHARGGVPPLRRWGALRTEPPLHVSACAVNDEPRGAK